MNIRNTGEGFQQGLIRVQLEEVGLIPEGVEVGKKMSPRRLLKIGSTTEVLNNGMDS